MKSKKNSKTKEKKSYHKPAIKNLGSLKKLSQTDSNGPGADGGSFPHDTHMCLTPPSSLSENRILLKDVACQNAYKNEIHSMVRDGDVVLDLGTGSGIHTLFALMAGAKKVYALDIHPLIETARAVIIDNGYGDKVQFIRGYSREVELPEKVDVIIANIGFMHTLNDLPDAVNRFLKPGGKVLPESAALTLVPVTAPELISEYINNWANAPYGIDFSAFRKLAVNHPIYWELKKENMLSAPQEQTKISFLNAVPKVLKWTQEFRINKNAELHGVGGWYSFHSENGEFLSTKPPMALERELWQNFVFPLEQSLPVQSGDLIVVELEMHREMIAEAPIWIWRVLKNNALVANQSSFAGVPTRLNLQ